MLWGVLVKQKGQRSGGCYGKLERVLEIMRDELARIEFAGEVRIVQFKKGHGRA